MGVELWIGQEFEHGHEMQALAAFLKNMVKFYTSDPTRFCVLANFIVNNSPVDLAVVKNNGLAVIELKQVGGPVFGGENGDWVIHDGNKKVKLKGGSKGNPYNQVSAYRISFLQFLNGHSEKFLQPRAGSQPRLDHVKGIVALAPNIPAGSEIDVPRLSWFKVVGLDELHREIFMSRSDKLALTPKEITRLIESVLGLRKENIAKYVEPTKRSVVSPAPAKPEITAEPIPAIEVPLDIVEPEKSDVAEVAFEDHDQAPCPVCSMGVPPCALKSLSGKIEGITGSDDSQYVFRILSDDFVPNAIPIHSCWNDYAKRLKSLIHTNQSVPVRILHLEKEGAKLMVGQNSLLIIEPDWLINV
ncbi:MAG: nuclease-related domain-containing protein, partial [Desulfomonilaceae bacterium]